MDVSVIIPAYNEAAAIGMLVERIRELHPDFEIIVINDGSSDDTGQLAENAGARVVCHPYNIGNGAAIKTGIREATGEILVMMDGDGQHRPEDIEGMLKCLPEYHMAVGARSGGDIEPTRKLANSIFNSLGSYVADFNIADLTSGFRAMKRKDTLAFIHLLPNKFSYPSTLTLNFIKSGRSIKYIPVEQAPRASESKISPVKDGVKFLLIIFKIATLYAPLKIFIPLSSSAFLAGFIFYLYTLTIEHRFSNWSLLLFVFAGLAFLVGVLAEQIAQSRSERNDT